MSATVDNRIVQLEMDNQQFENEAEKSIKTLDKLKDSMKFEDAAKNLSGLTDAASKFNIAGIIGDKIDSSKTEIAGKLTTWRLGLASALGNIASGLFGDLVIDPIKQSITGGIARSQNIADAKFQLEGLGVAWENVYEDINYAVEGTAYGLDAAAKAASQLSASSVELGDDMKAALRGISGVAAMGASSYEEITPIFTKAAGQGRVMADELNRISAHGLNAASELAKFFNTIEDRENVPEDLKKKVLALTKGMKVTETEIRDFASHSQIDFRTFAYAMDSAFGKHAKDANKTFTGSLANMKAALSRIGEQFRAPIMEAAVDVFNQLRLMINGVKSILNDSGIFEIWQKMMNMVGRLATSGISKAVKFLTEDFKGAQNISRGLYNILYAVTKVVDTIRLAFYKAFGRKGSGGIADSVNSAAEGFEKLTERIVPSDQAIQSLSKVMVTFFTYLKKTADFLGEFVDKYGDVLKIVLKLTVAFIALKGVMGFFAMHPAIRMFTLLGAGIAIVVKAVQFLITNWDTLKNRVMSAFPVLKTAEEYFKNISDYIGKYFNIALDSAVGFIEKLISSVKTLTFKDIKNQFVVVKNAVIEFVDRMREIPIVGKFIDNLRSAFEKVMGLISKAKTTITNFFVSATGNSRMMTRSLRTDMSVLEKVGTTVLNVFKTIGVVLGGAVLGAMTLFNKAFAGLKSISLDSVVTRLREFLAQVKNLTILDSIRNSLGTAGDKIVSTFELVIEKIRDFITRIKDGNYSLDGFAEKVNTVIQILATFKDKLIQAFTGDGEITRGGMGGGPLADFMQALGEKVQWLKEKFGDGLAYIREQGLLTKVLMIGYVLAILKVLLSFASTSKKIGEAVTSGKDGLVTCFTEMASQFGLFGQTVAGVIKYVGGGGGLLDRFFGGITNSLNEFAEAQKRTPMEQFVEVLKALAIVIVAVAGSLKILSTVPAEDLKTVAIVLGVLSGVLVLVAGVLAKINNTVKEGNDSINTFSYTLLALAGAVAVLAIVIYAMSKIDWGAGLTGFMYLLGVIGALYLVTRAIDKLDTSGTTLKGALFILAMAVVLRSMTKSLIDLVNNAEAFANLDPKALYSIAGLLVAFGFLCAIAGNVNLGNAIAAVIMLQVFKKFMQAVSEFAQVDYETILAYLYKARQDIVTALVLVTLIVSAARVFMKVLAVEMAKMAMQIGKSIAIAGAGFLAFAVGVMLLVGAIKRLSKLKLDGEQIATVVAGLLLISGMFVGLLASAKVFSGAEKGFLAVAGAFALLGLAAIQIAITAKILKKVEWPALIKALTILASITVLMGLLILAAKANNNNMGMKSLIAIVAGMALMFGELLILSVMVDNPNVFQNMLKAMMILGVILAAYGYVLGQAGQIKTGKSWGPILMILLTLGAIFGALYVLSKEIKSVEDLVGLGAIALILVGAVGGLIFITKKFMEFAKESNAGRGKWVTKSLAMLGVMIGAFAAVATILVLASRNADFISVGAMAITLSAAVVGLAYAAKIIMAATKKMKWNELGKAAAVLGVMVVAMGAIVAVVTAITNIQNGQITRAGGGDSLFKTLLPVLAILEILTLIAKQAANINAAGALKGSVALLAMVGLFTILALISGVLNRFGGDAKDMLKKTQVVALLLGEFVALLIILGDISGFAATAAAGIAALTFLTLVFGALATIAGLLNNFGGEAKDMLKKTQTVMLVLAELVGITALLGVMAPLATVAAPGIAALIFLTLVFGALATIAGLLNNFGGEAGDMLKKTQVISLVLLELVGITALLGVIAPLASLAIAAIPGLLGVVAVVGILALVASAIASLDLSKTQADMDMLISVMWKLVAISAILALLSVGSVGMVAGAAGILLLCTALVPLTLALQNLGGVNLDVIAQGLQSLAAAFGSMIAVAAGVAIMGAGLIVLALGIGSVGAACMLAAVGVQAFAVALMTLVAAAAPVIVAIKNLATEMVEGFKEKLSKLVELPGDIINAFKTKAAGLVGQLRETGKSWGEALLEPFQKVWGWHSPPTKLIQFFDDCGVAVNHEAQHVTELFDGTGESWGSALSKALTSKLSNLDLASIGKKMGIDLGNSALLGAMPGFSQIQAYINGIFGGAKAGQAELVEMMRKGQISSTEFNEKMAALNDTTGSLTDDTLGLTDALGGLTNGLKGAGGGAKSAKDELASFQDSLKSTLESQMNIFDKFEAKAAMSKEELLSNMKSQIDGMTSWATNMDKLSTMGIDKGLYQKLAEMGPQGAQYVGAFASMTAEEMARANDMWAQSLVLPGNIAGQITQSWSGISGDMVNGLSAGWTDAEGIFHQNILDTSQNAQTEFKEDNGIHSPSTVYAEFGYNMMRGLRFGVIDNRNLITTAMQQISSLAQSAAREGMASDKFAPIGAGIVEGLISGIESKEDGIYTKLQAIASKIEETLRSAKGLDVNSPSKRMIPIGEGVTEGLAVGVDKGWSVLDHSLTSVADRTIESMKYTIATIASSIQDGVEDPVITPVLDLSKLQAGVKTINSSFSASQVVGTRAAFEDLQNGEYVGNGNVIFNQNNYSPKALSRIEIYRDTRNLFAQAKGALS